MARFNSLKSFIILGVILSLVGCTHRRMKDDPKPIKVIESQQGQVTTQDPVTSEISPEEMAAANKDNLKIGILIGPGGARTWAAVGVLREFEKANIPVEVIGGMEWGSFIAALYSQKGKTNDVEWRSLKIEDSSFKKGMLSSNYESKNFSDFQKDLKTIFGSEKLESTKVKFVCGADSYRLNRSSLVTRGAFTEAMNYCVPYPPLVATYKGWNASAVRVKPYVDALKNMGANYLILIDVAQGGNPLGAQSGTSEAAILWMEIRNSLRNSGKSFNQVIEVRMNQSLNDFKARKEFIATGERIGKQAVQSLKDQL